MSIYPHQQSATTPTGSAGLVNQAEPSTVPAVAEEYGSLCESARDAALAKREADQVDLHGVAGL
jgi:hypothetical protein